LLSHLLQDIQDEIDDDGDEEDEEPVRRCDTANVRK